ncbi:uncharacterized protein [Nicotiana sylvestris]|uniref:uncharacterized protein n=1 Tax=Nicotiana sylvestris TaxID=4096 RepID=UPI00388CBF19
MLRAYVIDFGGQWDQFLPLAEFAYNNSYQSNIEVAPFETLYGRRCHSPIRWFEHGEAKLYATDLVKEALKKLKLIKERFHTTQSRQKSYADQKCQYLTTNTRVRDLSRGEVSPNYLAWYRKKNATRAEPERPVKKSHIQEFIEASQEQWAWLAKENEYRATIGKLEKQVRDLQFENGLQVTADEGEKKKLAKKNEALRAQIREMKTTAEYSARSAKDEKLIKNFRQKVDEYGFDLNKAEGEQDRTPTKLAKNAKERKRLVKQLKEKYDNEVVGLKKRVTIFENKMIKQAKNFKAERKHCYAAMSQLERDLQQLQEQHHVAEQTLEARAQQIGRLLQEKGVIREKESERSSTTSR